MFFIFVGDITPQLFLPRFLLYTLNRPHQTVHVIASGSRSSSRNGHGFEGGTLGGDPGGGTRRGEPCISGGDAGLRGILNGHLGETYDLG